MTKSMTLELCRLGSAPVITTEAEHITFVRCRVSREFSVCIPQEHFQECVDWIANNTAEPVVINPVMASFSNIDDAVLCHLRWSGKL